MTQAARDENFVTSTLLVGSTGETFPWEGDETTGRAFVDMPGGSGTVTSVSVVTANGFAGSVADPNTTPAITLSTTLNTPVIAGNGTALIAATTTGSGSVVLATSPTLVTPALGTPSSGVLTNCTGYPVANLANLGTGVAAALAVNVGSAGAFVTFNGALGTPSSGTVTNLTGTASININGTVGATTPTTGVFTTLVAGSTTSLLLGTAGSAVGNIGFRNATSGTITLEPVTGALGTVTLSLPAATDQLVGRATTDTLTNKRITKRTGTTTSSATPTINTDNVDEYYITAQTEAITSFTTNLSGTPTLGQLLFISVIGTAARGITWGASFANGPVALPTTTVTTTQLSVLLKWDGSIWRCYASGSTV